jgi:hypothetical protein
MSVENKNNKDNDIDLLDGIFEHKTSIINSDIHKYENEFIYVKHTNTIYTISYKGAQKLTNIVDLISEVPSSEKYGISKNNPIKTDAIKESTIPFIIKYIEYFTDKDETDPPEKPLPKVHISVIFGDEYKLFKDIYKNDDSLDDVLTTVNNLIDASLYFGFKKLHIKLCAIIASILIDSDINDVKQLVK